MSIEAAEKLLALATVLEQADQFIMGGIVREGRAEIRRLEAERGLLREALSTALDAVRLEWACRDGNEQAFRRVWGRELALVRDHKADQGKV